ncbi:glycosyltransferase family 4 protein [Thermomicrobium sp. CFH 73360]|uniref:glycosyltransferase family 4 protein n=1 Tax=Thermomicrobium sp. CFH 73360 TaxID=2951987 RepID=UPI002076F8A9|nr:glycosyltransferase family 1 protein [Thermomicrobium sp. CFH 73360]MCM8746701.1 glycosyltransferase family 4 protein [Thermomicrobium sp. CFH 73360]
MSHQENIAIDGRLLAYRRGGISRYIRCLAAAIATSEANVYATSGLTFFLIANRPIVDSPLPLVRVWTPPHHALEEWTLGWELARQPVSLVHATDFVLPRLPKRIRGVVTIHDLAFLDAPGELAPDAARYYARTLPTLRRADRIIAVSHATARRIAEFVPDVAPRIRVIHHGVDERWFHPHPDPIGQLTSVFGREPSLFLSARPIVLAVGTIEPRKRYDLLLDAFLALHRSLESAPFLVIVGQEGWNATETVLRIRSYQERGILRWFPDADDGLLHALYSIAAVLVVPSRDEGFCLPALEALAAGVPVVAFAVGALPEVVGDAALLVHDQTIEALAEACRVLLQNESLRQTYARRGRARARQFSWARAAEQTLTVYREALEDGR